MTVPLTTSPEAAELDHVIYRVLAIPVKSPLEFILKQNGYATVDHILEADDAQFLSQTYIDENIKVEDDEQPEHKRLLPGMVSQFKVLRQMSAYYGDEEYGHEEDPIEDWNLITRENFMHFRRVILPRYGFYIPTQTKPTSSNKSPTSAATTLQSDPVKDFKKSIKRDSAQFPKLSDNKNWDTFVRSFVIEAKAQGLENILDPDYDPKKDEAKLLFKYQNDFMLSVFDKKLQTDQAKEAIRQHCNSKYPAQLIYKTVKAHAEKGTGAQIESHRLLGYLTTVRWGSPTLHWNSGCEAFVRHYKDKIRTYEKDKKTAPFPDDIKLVMFQNALSGHPDLAAVQQTDEMLRARTGDSIDFEKYFDLVISAAQRYDKSKAGSTGKVKGRAVYAHDQFATFEDDDPISSIDSPIDTLSVYQADRAPPARNRTDKGQRRPSSRMPFSSWKKLTPEQQTQWDKMPDEAKSIILATTQSQKVNLHDVSAQEYLESKLQVNLTDISAHELMVNYHEGEATDKGMEQPYFFDADEPSADTDKSPDGDESSGLQVNTMKMAPSRTAMAASAKPSDDTIVDSGANGTINGTILPPDKKKKATKTLVPKVPASITQVLSSAFGKTPVATKPAPKPAPDPAVQTEVVIGDKRYVLKDSPPEKRDAHTITWNVCCHETEPANRSYRVSNHGLARNKGALVDRGANGCVFGDDVRMINTTGRKVDITGLDNHQVSNKDIGTAAGVTETHVGPVIAIFHQGAYHGRGRSIIAPAQLEAFGVSVSDQHRAFGGMQCISADGYVIPIAIRNSLPYIPLRPYTDAEWDSMPHIFLTSDEDWDPSLYDHDPLVDDEDWVDALQHLLVDAHGDKFDRVGDYKLVHPDYTDQHRQPTDVNLHYFDAEADSTAFADLDQLVDDCVDYHAPFVDAFDGIYMPDENLPFLECHHNELTTSLKPRDLKHKPPDYDAIRPLLAWLPVDIVKKTFEATTQYARMPFGTHLKKRYRTPFPAANVPRRPEAVSTDKIISDTPAVDSGATQAQLYVGIDSQVTDPYPTKSDKEFVNTFQDNIRERGAPTKLISDGAMVEIAGKVKDLLRYFCIGGWHSEAGHQHQNPSERRINTVKTTTNTVMDRTGSPPNTWLLCLMYVCFLLNHTFNASIGCVPLSYATGSPTDISPLLCFCWYEPVYYRIDDSDFPSDSREGRGRFVGFADNVGHVMTFKVLTDDTQKVIYRSNIRSALSPLARNLRIDPLNDDGSPDQLKQFIRSFHDPPDGSTPNDGESGSADPSDPSSIPMFHPSDLVGRTFLMDEQEDGQRFRARIVEAIEQHEKDFQADEDFRKFRVSINDDEYEELLTYDQVLQYITSRENDEGEIIWKFRKITAHEGPLRPGDPTYNGSKFNIMVEWENGEVTTEPLAVIAKDDPATVAQYAYDSGLLDTPGWQRFRKMAKNQKKLLRQVNQAKLRSYRTAPRYKYGYEIPRNGDYKHAVDLDKAAKNTKWQDSTRLELDQIDSYQAFQDLGKDAPAPIDYKKIRVHLVFDVKHDGRHKARLVADGHLTDTPVESVYSGVVSLRGIRLMIFLAELNGMETWATDIGNAYLEAKTKEKVYIIAGPEFGERQGHTLVIHKALYGLKSSGRRWHERLATCLRGMGFEPCKAEPDIWMRRVDDHYEYIGVYVDDLAIVSKDPQAIITKLENDHKFKLKGTGPISYHLGCDFVRDPDGTLCMMPKKFIERMCMAYESHFGVKPNKKYSTPLDKGDHPETDLSELLGDDDIRVYQSLIGTLQWAVSLARFDIASAVMTLSSFRAAPRQGHLERAKRVCCYLYRFASGGIRVRVHEPDYSGIPVDQYDWTESVYGKVYEVLPHDAPEPLGNYVRITHYVDANLYHDYITGRSVTGIIDLLNGFPVDWYCKKQATVETATYGSEFVAARTCVERSIDYRNTLRYLGVPIRKEAYMFGDNKSVVDSSTIPHSKLHKRHNALSFHRVREAIAGDIIRFHHIPGEINPADMLSKHWGYQATWPQLRPLLFWRGETATMPDGWDQA